MKNKKISADGMERTLQFYQAAVAYFSNLMVGCMVDQGDISSADEQDIARRDAVEAIATIAGESMKALREELATKDGSETIRGTAYVLILNRALAKDFLRRSEYLEVSHPDDLGKPV